MHKACAHSCANLNEWVRRTQARALSLSQRMLLYAHDELDMATMRLRLRGEGEHVQPHEEHFKLHPAELPVKQRVRSLASAALALRQWLHALGSIECAPVALRLWHHALGRIECAPVGSCA